MSLNTRKATQAAAVILRTEQTRRMNYMKLLKLLYLAERETLRDTGRSITGDRFVAMKRGPVLSGVYDLIKGEHIEEQLWGDCIERDRFMLTLAADPGVDLLSRFEIQKLGEVALRHVGDDEFQMVDFVHRNCPEWKDPGSGVRPIELASVLAAVGRGADSAAIIHDIRQSQASSRFFSRTPTS